MHLAPALSLALLATVTACSSPSGQTPGASVAAPVPEVTSSDASPGAQKAATRLPSARVVSTVTTRLAAPWDITFLPDSSALISQRDNGRILALPAAGGRARVVGTVPRVAHGGEGGLLGLAVGADFARTRWVYAYFTSARDNRVVRMRLNRGRLGAPQVILRGIPRAGNHNGGRMVFGPDKMLYVGTGDASSGENSQNRGSLAGKILRMTPEGRVARGNPFRGSLVWSYGHRNVQGLAFDARGQLWASEFGQNTWDELNRIVKGGNYGWPRQEGKGGGRGLIDPVHQWHTDMASPSGLAIAGTTAYLAGLRGQRLWQVPLAGGTPRALFARSYGRLREVAAARDGTLWLMTNNTDGRGSARRGDDRILRVRLTR